MDTRGRLWVITTIGIALILTLVTAGDSLWLMRASSTGHLMDPAHMQDREHQMDQMPGQAHASLGQPADHAMMGPPSTRGVFGGHLGAVTGLMGLVFVMLVAILAWLLIHERPGRPQQALCPVCPVCSVTIETDWTTCAYCGSALAQVGISATSG